jgi:hypothetical protein
LDGRQHAHRLQHGVLAAFAPTERDGSTPIGLGRSGAEGLLQAPEHALGVVEKGG